MDREVIKSKKSSLGKGLGSLLGDLSEEPTTSKKNPIEPSLNVQKSEESRVQDAELVDIELDRIDPNPVQPRKSFSAEEIQELAASISEDGVLQPVIVVQNSKQIGRFVLVAGERRLRACKIAGKSRIPAIVKSIQSDEMLRLALIENIQRSDLNVIEEALAYESLISEHGLTQEECAQKLGKDRSTISNGLRILGLPNSVKEDLINKKLTMGHARALAGLKSEEEIEKIRELIHKRSLSVRQTEQLCRNLKLGKPIKPAQTNIHPDLEYLAERLRSHLRTKVKLSGNPNRGKIEISFFSPTELDRIMSSMGYDV